MSTINHQRTNQLKDIDEEELVKRTDHAALEQIMTLGVYNIISKAMTFRHRYDLSELMNRICLPMLTTLPIKTNI